MNVTLDWKAEDIIRAVRGRSLHDQSWSAQGISIDSRTVNKGDLFIALVGPSHDGHDHVAAAFAAGAVGAIVARQPEQVPAQAHLVFVDDTFKALEMLGAAGRARAQGKIVAVTGSVGKTGTKEMLRLMLGACGATFATQGSLNNHWGVPLSLARLPQDAEYGVFELGMNHAGEMTLLSQHVKPHIVLITTIEPAHMEFFESLESVADAKAEIFDGLHEGGTVVLNRDNSQFQRLHDAARTKGIKKILSFGRDKKADAVIHAISGNGQSNSIDATILGRRLQFGLRVPGEHMAMNAMGALLVADAAGGDSEASATALAHYQAPERRGVMSDVLFGDGHVTLIDESYNASPAAVVAAIRVLGGMQPHQNGRRILVLGDMREMGTMSEKIHADLAQPIVDNAIDLVYCCGTEMLHLYNTLPLNMRGLHGDNSVALADAVAATLHAGDIVTVKGSKSMHMEIVVNAIKALGTLHNQRAS